MTTHTHLGHIFHIAGEPKVTEAAAALVSIPDGALVLDDSGRIVFCGNGALNSLNRLANTQSRVRINYDGIVEVFGMKEV